MADPRLVAGASAPLFDRLVDFTPDASAEAEVFRHLPSHALRSSVRREIERLLATKRPITVQNALEETSLTVLEYGVPDFTNAVASDPVQMERYARALEKALRCFEPRLKDPVVAVRPDPDRRHAFQVVVHGAMCLGRHMEDVWFPIHIAGSAASA